MKKKREETDVKKILCICFACLLLICGVACTPEEPEVPGTNYAFRSGNTEIAIDADAAPILASLGEWRDYAESASCAFEGLDKVYTYAGFEVQTYPMNGKDYVYMVMLYDDTVATPEGVRIGQDTAAVTAAYGEPTQQTDTALIYQAQGMRLEFLLTSGVITNIKYCKEA
jgi:hypothetical protein